MRLLHVNQGLGVGGGGIAQFIRDSAPALAARDVDIVATTAEQDPEVPTGVGEHVYLPEIRALAAPQGAWCGRLEATIASGVDVAHVHEVKNLEIIRHVAEAVPTVIHLHNYNFWCPGNDQFFASCDDICGHTAGWRCVPNAYLKRCNNRHPVRLTRSIRNTLAKRQLWNTTPALFVVSSAYMHARAVDAGIPAEKLRIVPYAVREDRFDGTRGKAVGSIAPGYLLYVGRLSPVKGIPYLLDAVERLPKEYARTQLVIVGDGSNRPQIEREIDRRGLQGRVMMAGLRSGAELSWLYLNCSMLVVPSIWAEVFGIIGLEAMAAKKPVVAFDVGGISQWLTDGVTGYLAPRKDASVLAERMQALLANPARAEAMGDAGHQRFCETFTGTRQAALLVDTYRQAIKQFQCT